MQFKITDLWKTFDKDEVLRGINYTFEEGKIYGLLGRNGAGKTTFFNCVNEDIEKDHGEFTMIDKAGNERELDLKEIGYVLSTPTVPEFLTGREFLKFFIDINKEQIHDLKSIDEYFDLVKIKANDRDKLMKDYSHGMKNKMQLLTNFIVKPNLLLLDEPLTSLDVVVAEEMKEILRDFKENRILILSTHIMELALEMCDEIVILHHGYVELVDRDTLNHQEFKDKIIEALRDDE